MADESESTAVAVVDASRVAEALPSSVRRYAGLRHKKLADLLARFEAEPDPLNLFGDLNLLRALLVLFIEEYDEQTEALGVWHELARTIMGALPDGLVAGFDRSIDIWERKLKKDGEWAPERERQKEQARRYIRLLERGADTQRPRKVASILDAERIITAIGQLVERIEKMRTANAISEQEFSRLVNLMGRAADVAIPNGIINAGVAVEADLITGEKLKSQIRKAWLDILTR